MKIAVRNLDFGYSGTVVFNRFSAELDSGGGELPLVILGPSGSGKTTLLRILGGLLKPQGGEIIYSGTPGGEPEKTPPAAFMFQEPRLLPWLTALENVSLPLEKLFGKAEACRRARRFLSLVALGEKENALPGELSGGQARRVSMARAFAWPAPLLFMDEPFQSLDIPLRISLMNLTLSLPAEEQRLLVVVTHDHREAVYMGGRIIVIGKAGEGVVCDKIVGLSAPDRAYGSAAGAALETELIRALGATERRRDGGFPA